MPSVPLPLIVLAVVACLLDLLILCLPAILRRRGVYLWWRTMFGPALVFDSQDDDSTTVRLLNVRGKYQSVAYVDRELRWELACVYHKYFAQVADIAGLAGAGSAPGPSGHHASAAQPGPSGHATPGEASFDDAVEGAASAGAPTAVVIGGGGYSFPKWLVAHCPRLHTTVVEVDPQITAIAREHFFLDELIREFDAEGTRLELVCDDGWAWLRGCGRSFDLVVNDAFSGKRPLGPLGTAEGARLIHEHLTPSGLYFANVIAPLEGKGSEHLHDVLAAFKAEFAHVWLIPEADDQPELTGDNVLVASDRALGISHIYLV